MADSTFPIARLANAVLSPNIGGREIPAAKTFTVTNLVEVTK